MKFLIPSLLTFVLIVAALGCGPYRAEVNKDPLQETEKVLLLDAALTRYLNVVKHHADRLAAGQLEVKIAIENEENKDVWADVQVIFQDGEGFEMEKSNWEATLFQGNRVTTIKRNSLSPKAADFRVLIRNIK